MLGVFEKSRDGELANLKSDPVMPKKSLDRLQEETRDLLSEQSARLQGVIKHIDFLCALNGDDPATPAEFNSDDYKEFCVIGATISGVSAKKMAFGLQYAKLLSIRGSGFQIRKMFASLDRWGVRSFEIEFINGVKSELIGEHKG